MLIILIFSFFKAGSIEMISDVAPEFEIIIAKSFWVIAPRSPCVASAGCKKNDGVPVLERVAEIFLAIWPDLPMPINNTLPFVSRISSHASLKDSSITCSKFLIVSYSDFIVRFADAMCSFIFIHLKLFSIF